MRRNALMDDLQREELIHWLADSMEDSWYLSTRDFVYGFSFVGFGNMSDDELIGEAQGQDWDDEEWFQKILLAHQLKKDIEKA
jgi:hypothetical protein